MNIFLIGPMGVGKTTIGRSLSRQLGLKFYDSDQEIEHRAGADIAWIFDVEGEAGFRERETQVIEELTALDNILIATGGGAILRPVNRMFLRSRGVVIFLDTSLELLVKRTAKDKKRPMLQNADRESVLRRIKTERQPIYEEVSHIQVFVGEGSSRRVVNSIVEKLKEEGYVQD